MRVLERKNHSHINLMALYEANFEKFVAMIPDGAPGELLLRNAAYSGMVLQMRALERAPYTSTWQVLAHYAGVESGLPCPTFRVRLYHDAKVLEVLFFQGRGRFLGEYPYPNPWMFARDEKRQVNKFFGELLGYCVVNGFRAVAAVQA
ncbi:MAG: DUF1249 domain-containing protein [Gammaproteobacteria bacterium]|nr:DUF1249 domain-containing protein [Gammaproteobacteria bacterium]